jgi:hypothetical protein
LLGLKNADSISDRVKYSEEYFGLYELDPKALLSSITGVMLCGSIIMAWHLLRLWMEMASKYGGSCGYTE